MLKKFAATLLIPLIFTVSFAFLFVSTKNIVFGVLMFLFGLASIYYGRELFRPDQREAPDQGEKRSSEAGLPDIRVYRYSDKHMNRNYAHTLFQIKIRDGNRTTVDVDISSGRLYRVTRDASGEIVESTPVSYAQLRDMPNAGRFRGMTEKNWEEYLPEKQRLQREMMTKPLEIPAAYCNYRSRNPVTKFYYTVSMPDRNVIVYFRSTEDGYRVFQAQGCEPGLASSLLSDDGNPEDIMEEILAGGYENKHFDACDRRLSEEETACIQHLFDHEANTYKAKVKDIFASSYVYRKKTHRVTSGSRYAFFMQYVLQAVASRGMVVTAQAENADLSEIKPTASDETAEN